MQTIEAQYTINVYYTLKYYKYNAATECIPYPTGLNALSNAAFLQWIKLLVISVNIVCKCHMTFKNMKITSQSELRIPGICIIKT